MPRPLATPFRSSRVLVSVLAALTLVLAPAAANARAVKSKIAADVSGEINRQGTVTYYFSGVVGAQGFAFGCMEGRRVVLFRVEEGGTRRKVAFADTGLFGSFVEPIEKPVSALPGRYYAEVEPRVRKVRKGRLRCLAARTATFLVRVPPELLTAEAGGR